MVIFYGYVSLPKGTKWTPSFCWLRLYLITLALMLAISINGSILTEHVGKDARVFWENRSSIQPLHGPPILVGLRWAAEIHMLKNMLWGVYLDTPWPPWYWSHRYNMIEYDTYIYNNIQYYRIYCVFLYIQYYRIWHTHTHTHIYIYTIWYNEI